MVKLSGILEYSMGGFLCLRGFASYKMLSQNRRNLHTDQSLLPRICEDRVTGVKLNIRPAFTA